MNEQERVLYDIIEELENQCNGGYYGINDSDFEKHVKRVKEVFGFDYFAHKTKLQEEARERLLNQPTDHDPNIKRAKRNY